MNVLDFIVIAIFIVCIFSSYYRGFFKEVFKLIAFILGILFFKMLYPIVNNWLLKSIVFEKFKEWVVYNLNIEKLVVTTQEEIVSLIQSLDIPQIFKELLIKNNNSFYYEMFNVNNAVDYIANFIAIVVISLLTVFLVILIVFILMIILSKKINILSKLPVLGTFDKIGGIVIGIVKGLFIVWVLGIILLVLSIFPQLSFLKEQFDGPLTELLINNNILIKLLLKSILGIVS